MYYEIGYNLPINSSRKHVGEDVTSGDTIQKTITNQTATTLTISGSDLLPIVPGESIRFGSDPDSTSYQVSDIQYLESVTIFYFQANILPQTTQTSMYWESAVSRTILKKRRCLFSTKRIKIP